MGTTPLFGITYLEPVDFRASAALFGVGMAMCDYPAGSAGDEKLANAIAAASRMIDSHCGIDFSPANRAEQQKFKQNGQFQVNNFPVAEIVSCSIKFTTTVAENLRVADIYVNNQEQYLEITTLNQSQIALESNLVAVAFDEPVIEIVYKSRSDIPSAVRLAAGYQTAQLINSGFVDKTLPPNFGKIDMTGLGINNKKGYRSSEEMSAGSFSAEAERLLAPFKNIVVA